MALFPMFMDLSGRFCLILGGGAVALRKAQTLLKAGGCVHVWAESLREELRQMARDHKVILEDSSLSPESLIDKADLVVCATSDRALNDRMTALCSQRHIWVNCAAGEGTGEEKQDPGNGIEKKSTEFIFPSLIINDTVCVGIATFPAAPSLSKHIRQEIETWMPQWYGSLGRRLAELRQALRCSGLKTPERSRVMGRLTEYGLCHEGVIPEEIFFKFIDEERKQ